MASRHPMGTFAVRIRLPTGEEMDALVDTGSTFTKMPRRLLEGLGVRPTFEREVELGNGEGLRSRWPWEATPNEPSSARRPSRSLGSPQIRGTGGLCRRGLWKFFTA